MPLKNLTLSISFLITQLCLCQQSASSYTKSITIERTYYTSFERHHQTNRTHFYDPDDYGELVQLSRTYFYDPSDLEQHLIIVAQNKDSIHALHVNHRKYGFLHLLKTDFLQLETVTSNLQKGYIYRIQGNKKKKRYYLKHYKIIRFKDTVINNEAHHYFGVVPKKKKKFKYKPRSYYIVKKDSSTLPLVPYNHARILLNELDHDIKGFMRLGFRIVGKDTSEISRGYNENSIYKKLKVIDE